MHPGAPPPPPPFRVCLLLRGLVANQMHRQTATFSAASIGQSAPQYAPIEVHCKELRLTVIAVAVYVRLATSILRTLTHKVALSMLSGPFSEQIRVTDMTTCKIRLAQKDRDDSSGSWCLTHKYNASGTDGSVTACAKSKTAPKPKNSHLSLKGTDYPGGIGVWCQLPPAFSSFTADESPPIHVHARKTVDGSKDIDKSVDSLTVEIQRDRFSNEVIFDKYTLESFFISHAFGTYPSYVTCDHCGAAHHDEKKFAAIPHEKHSCKSCGRDFSSKKKIVSNPLARHFVESEQILGAKSVIAAPDELDLQTKKHPGGYQFWASNPAALWTAQRPEESGIHVHAFSSTRHERTLDGTYAKVRINGISINLIETQIFMAQRLILQEPSRLCHLICKNCSNPILSKEECALTPSKKHLCQICGTISVTDRAVIANPFINTLRQLKSQGS